MDIFEFGDFVSICDCLFRIGLSEISIYTDGFLRNLDTAGCRAGAAAFFENISMGLDVGVSDHSGVSGNECANLIAGAVSFSGRRLLPCLDKCYIIADSGVVFGNSRYFVHDIYHSICHAHWEVGSGSKFLVDSLLSEVDWPHSSLV
ncbi:hypothetical protein G9A89_018472 [Geosiphon pyriformis]|nr:hypothetical protein G9A89_018472 [Geosiphon pyriformis]